MTNVIIDTFSDGALRVPVSGFANNGRRQGPESRILVICSLLLAGSIVVSGAFFGGYCNTH